MEQYQIPLNDGFISKPIYTSILPDEADKEEKLRASDNLVALIGSNSVQIFDLEQEKWVFAKEGSPYS